MKKLWTSSAIILMALFTLAPLASALSPQERDERQERQQREEREENRRRVEPRFRLNFGLGYQPYGYRYRPYGYYQPYGYAYSAGVVRLHFPYQAQVWVDDNFVGDDMHNVTLSPGTHEIELRDGYGNIMFEQNVNVIGGRTIDVFTQGY
jgi:hypothetical protein